MKFTHLKMDFSQMIINSHRKGKYGKIFLDNSLFPNRIPHGSDSFLFRLSCSLVISDVFVIVLMKRNILKFLLGRNSRKLHLP